MRQWRLIGYLTLLVSGAARADEAKYLEALRQQGYADLAVVYLKGQLESPGITESRRAELEYWIGATLLMAADLSGDLGQRDQGLEEGRNRLRAFVARYPKLPQRAAALEQVAFADLQQGRLRVLQAQLPANSGQAVALAEQARALLDRAAQAYGEASQRLEAEHRKLPLYIPETNQEGRREKSRLFARYIEARFQAALCRFHAADSFVAIEAPAADSTVAKDIKTARKPKAAWQREFQLRLAAAQKDFAAIHEAHRREYVGLVARLWLARCCAAAGDHRKARGIFDELAAHEDRALEPLKREAFYFRLLSLAAQEQWDDIIAQGEVWLKHHARFQREPGYFGVMFELGRAYARLAESAAPGAEQNRRLDEANRHFGRLSGTPNAYTGLARREQMRLAEHFAREISARSFQQLFSLANAKLDLVSPKQTAQERQRTLEEAKQFYRQAIAAARRTDSSDSVNDARLALAFAHLQDSETLHAAVLAESLARDFPASGNARRAGAFAIAILAQAFEEAHARWLAGSKITPDAEARRLRDLADFMQQRWPGATETVEAQLTCGRLEYARRDFAGALAVLARIDAAHPRFGEALSMSGRCEWEWSQSLRLAKGEATRAADLQRQARDHLTRASELWAAGKMNFSRERFLNELVLAEILAPAQPAAALARLQPLVTAIEQRTLANDIEAAARLEALTATLQLHVRLNQLEACDKLVTVISRQQGQSESQNVTQVFVRLAGKLKEQLEQLKSSGDELGRAQTALAFERFLDRVAEREAGHTVQSRVNIAANFVALERYPKAIKLLRQALAVTPTAEAAPPAVMVRARLLLAKAHAGHGELNEARKLIDALFDEQRGVREVIQARGTILEQQGDYVAASQHYRDAVGRMSKLSPRPADFYELVERLLQTTLQYHGGDRTKRLAEAHRIAKFLLVTEHDLPEHWRKIYEIEIAEIESRIKGDKP